MKDKDKKVVYVAMSGGVDSSVAALLLKNDGYRVVGVYMKNWSGSDYAINNECPWEKDIEDVEKVCNKLGIEFKSYNFEKEYRERVVKYFFNEYSKGRTPNPDVMCNKEIKFDLFLNKAIGEGADFIATGHYANIKKIGDQYFVSKGKDKNKDQSYFLCALNQFQLSKTIFPLGNREKPEVRRLAKENDLHVADKKDSQGICFIGKIDVVEYLKSHISTKKGIIINQETKEIVGEHEGVYFYTIGQRTRLGIGGSKLPIYVSKKDVDNNILYVVEGENNPLLYKNKVLLEEVIYTSQSEKFDDIEVSIRYRQKPIKAKILGKEVQTETPLKAVSPGQILVMYSKEKVVGYGILAE